MSESAKPGQPLLLTPGPLTTAPATREAMLRDFGSRDAAFLSIDLKVRKCLLDIAGGSGRHLCVPIQGSGTFAIEAMLGTIMPADATVLILVNGAYGRRMEHICARIGRQYVIFETNEKEVPDPADIGAVLANDPEIGFVAMVHCETTSGILNPLEEIAQVVARYGRRLLVDAMSSFGALPINVAALGCSALAASSNKCLEGVPGLAFVIVAEDVLSSCAGNAPSLSLDLYDQQRGFVETGQWRFTPPTHVVAALDKALDALREEGGVAAREERYRNNCRILVAGMRALGFETFLVDDLQAPIIVTFALPEDPRFTFSDFYDRLEQHGYVIYPGKLTNAETFRIGCIGHVGEPQMHGVVQSVADVLDEMGVQLPTRQFA